MVPNATVPSCSLNGVTLTTRSSIVFACHTSACRPPTSGGTGGSYSSGRPIGKGQRLTVTNRGSTGKHPGTVNTSKDDNRALYGKRYAKKLAKAVAAGDRIAPKLPRSALRAKIKEALRVHHDVSPEAILAEMRRNTT